MSTRLTEASLSGLPATRPGYDRRDVTSGIVHLGIGGFHRAHQAVYTDGVLANGELNWGITGVSLRSRSVVDALAPQDFLYCVETRSNDERSRRVIGSVVDVLTLAIGEHLPVVIDCVASPATQVITMTITEKGYCQNNVGALDVDHPDIVHDLAQPDKPRSAPGLLARALHQRHLSGAGPLTVLSCDNVSSNGVAAHIAVATMIAMSFPDSVSWLEDNVSFPSSMVDRIVPSTSTDDLTRFESETGYVDQGLLTTEPFSQWVIEDNFRAGKPGWGDVGAQLVADVAPFERAKLSLLNASHSALAYLGLLSGYRTIHESIADPTLNAFVQKLIAGEILPTITPPAGLDVQPYIASIMQRFSNASLPYTTLQVASDGSMKLPQRIYPAISARLARGDSIDCLSRVVAAWLRCLDPKTAIAGVKDPAARKIGALAEQHSSAERYVAAVAQETRCFGELASSEVFLETVAQSLSHLQR